MCVLYNGWTSLDTEQWWASLFYFRRSAVLILARAAMRTYVWKTQSRQVGILANEMWHISLTPPASARLRVTYARTHMLSATAMRAARKYSIRILGSHPR